MLRWVAVGWFAVWLPAYTYYWGWRNFLQLCDIAVFLTVAGLWVGSSLLLSSQAVNVLVVSLFWAADAAWRVLLGRHLMGGTEYLWDERFPLCLRLLSLYHLALPVALLWALRRTGYDARGWKLQAAIAAVAMVAARLLEPVENYNMVYRDPFFGRLWGPAAVHIAFMWVTLVAVVYWPTHWALQRILRRANVEGSRGLEPRS
jgi:hypothetical protein